MPPSRPGPERVAVSIGGSFFITDKGPDTRFARKVADLIADVAEKRRICVVVGGGRTARTFIETCRELGADEGTLDEIGIAATRLNAWVLLAALPHAYPKVAETIDEALLALGGYPIVVMGGTHPGHTTDNVAIMAAERMHAARIVIATNVDGVYDADPKKDAKAKRLPRLPASRLVQLTDSSGSVRAGSTGIVDPLAARMLVRARIPCHVVLGTDLAAVRGAIEGAAFQGSVVEPG